MSKSMFIKGFFGIFHGSISKKIDNNKFIINKKNAVFDHLDDDNMLLLYTKKDYRWNDASIDSDIHLNIYKNIDEAKFICYAMPAYAVACSLKYDAIEPKDYFGCLNIPKLPVYNPKQFADWYERAPSEIYRYMLENNTNVMIIKGYGVYAYARTLHSLAKTIALVENSCKVLQFNNN